MKPKLKTKQKCERCERPFSPLRKTDGKWLCPTCVEEHREITNE